MSAHQPEMSTLKIQPSTVLTDDVCGGLDTVQALSEVLSTRLIFAASSERDPTTWLFCT